jgi:hypothetical protein
MARRHAETLKGPVMLELPATSTEYIRVPVSAKEAAAWVNPTGDVVKMAVLAAGTATPAAGASSWVTAGWETDSSTDPDTYYARAQLSAFAVGVGVYDVWVQIVDTPETVIRRSGQLRVF